MFGVDGAYASSHPRGEKAKAGTSSTIPSRKYPSFSEGSFFCFAAIILPVHRDLSRAAPWLAIGAGMILYGVTDISLRRSPLRVLALLVALALWLSGVYWALNIAL
jgi:hypothetical protein